jgi:hypothetical protein
MTIGELKEQLPTIEDDKQRAELLQRLFKLFCPISYKTIMVFNRDWDGSKSYKEYVEAVNKEIITCINMEVSDIGKMTREALKLKPISLETELPTD